MLGKAVRNPDRDLAPEGALRLDEDTSGVAGEMEITRIVLEESGPRRRDSSQGILLGFAEEVHRTLRATLPL